MIKGSIQWFEEITNRLGELLVGIEISHYDKNQDIIPRCQVTFVLKESYNVRYPAEVISLRNMEGYRMVSWVNRGRNKKSYLDMKTAVLFDFNNEEICPRHTMIKVAEKLGFTVAPKFLNSKEHTARLSPTIYQ